MSTEALIKEAKDFILNADETRRAQLHQFLKGESAPADWWDELPETVQEGIEEGIRDANAGRTISWNDFKVKNPQWFRR